MDGDPQLFGAPQGKIQTVIMMINPPEGSMLGRVQLNVFTENRRDPMKLVFDELPFDQMSQAIGYAIPLVLKSSYVNASQLRRHFWAVWRGLSLDWREVGIKGCGTEPRNRES